MDQTLVLTETDVQRLLDVEEAFQLVQECYRAIGGGLAENLTTVGINFSDPLGRCSLKSGYLRDRRGLGIKIHRVHPENRARFGLPMHNIQIVLVDGETGLIRSILGGVHVTRVRTGAAGAVGAHLLARSDARRVAVVGAGTQGRAQLEALVAERSLDSVTVCDQVAELREAYAKEMSESLGLRITPTESIEKACRQAEIIVTATTSNRPLVQAEWVQPGTHVTAIGADKPNMQELDPRLLQKSKVVVDDLKQCAAVGEISVPIREGRYTLEQVHASIGEVAAGLKPGRTDPNEITIFDSTGMGVQDAVAADFVYQRARSLGIGTWITL